MRTWFITGASRGLGAAIAAKALAAGDAVVATARRAEPVSERFGDNPMVYTLPLDVTNEAQAREAAAAAVTHFGRIDVLVNNAGYGLVGAIEEASGAEVERLFATNVFGLLSVTRAVLPVMRQQRSGHVLHMSSVGGYAASSGFGIYCASKFAVEAIGESMRAELGPVNVKVTLVEPGYFRTGFLDPGSIATTAERIEDYHETVNPMRSFVRGAGGQQPGDPARLAAAILEVVDMPDPPLRVALGPDSVERILLKHRSVLCDLYRSHATSMSTGFARPA